MRRLVFFGLAVALAMTLTACDWPMFGYDLGHSRSSPDPALTTGNVRTLTTKWTGTTAGPVQSSPAVVNGVVYVGSAGGSMHAFNATTGASLWTAGSSSPVNSSPAVVDGVVYVGANNDRVYAFDATSGATLWSALTGGEVFSSPAVANGTVFVGSSDGHLYAFDATTGARVWSATTRGFVESSPAVVDGTVYVGSGDGNLYAFDAAGVTNCSETLKTCSPLWSASTGGEVLSPAVVDGIAYVGSTNGNVFAFDAKTGETLWTSTATASGGPSSPAMLWTATTAMYVLSSPAVANGMVYVGSDKVYAFGLT
jgi:outer membrane protein assembly factor BamB